MASAENPEAVVHGRVQGATSLLEYSADTTVGSRRYPNEDAFAAFPDTNTFLVVDGCGGVSSGESAARLTVECFRQALREEATGIDSLRVADPLAVAVLRANAAVFREANTKPALRGQGATLCALRAFEKWVMIAHVGDCRVGRFRDNVLAWLTEDHSNAVTSWQNRRATLAGNCRTGRGEIRWPATPELLWPPAIRTWPLASSVAVGSCLATVMLPVATDVPLVGS